MDAQFENDSNINAKSYLRNDQTSKKIKIKKTDVPANYQVAYRHGQVFNLHQIPQDYKGQWQCECCGRFSKPYSVHMRTSTDYFSYLGTPYPLYFDFIKMTFLFLISVLFISGIYNLSINNSQNICISQGGVDQISDTYDDYIKNNKSPVKLQIQCQKNWITKFSLGNRGNDKGSLFIQDILNLITVLALILVIHYIVKRQKEKQIKLDNYFLHPNSFTVHISNIPLKLKDANNNYEQLFQDYIENKMNLIDISTGQKIDMKGSIQKITFCFDIDDLIELEQEIKDLEKKKIESINKNGYGSDEVYLIEQQIQISERKIEILKLNFSTNRTEEFMVKYFCGQAFVTFKYQYVAFQFLESVNRSISFFEKQSFYLQGQKLFFQEAAIPDDVQWMDLYKTTLKSRFKSFIINNFIYILAIIAGIVSYVLITLYSYLGITNNNHEYASYDNVVSAHLTAVGLAIIMYALNNFIYIFIERFLRQFHFNSQTRRMTITANLTIFIQFIINNVMPFAILSSKISNYSLYSMLYNPTGFSILQTYIFFLQTVIPIILSFIDIPYLLKCFYRERAHLTNQSQYINQEELGIMFENPEFDLGYHYSFIIRIIYSTMFHAPMIPMCLIWSLGGLIIYYITSKFQLIYRRVVKNDIGTELSFSILHHFPISLIIFSISSYCFHRINDPQEVQKLIPSIIAIIISSTNFLFIPLFRSNAKIFEIDVDNLTFINFNKPYEEVQNSFKTDYDKLNPAMNTNLLEKYRKIENLAFEKDQLKYQGLGKNFKDITPKSQADTTNNNLNLRLINSKKSSFLDLKMIERSSNFGLQNEQFYQSLAYASQYRSNNSQIAKIQNKYLQQSQLSIDKIIENQKTQNKQISGNTQDLIPLVQQQLNIIKKTQQPDSQFVEKQILNNKWLLDQIKEYQTNYNRSRSRQNNQSDFLLVSQLKAQLEQCQQILMQQAKSNKNS